METIVNIILAPWTFFQWIFSIGVWYFILSLLFAKGDHIDFDRWAVRKYVLRACDWLDRRWNDAKVALRFGK